MCFWGRLMNQDRTKRKLTAIFSSDVVEYSRLMEADEAWTIQSLEENKKLLGELIEEYEGRVIDFIGDNLLAEFSSVTNAVECAVKIQQDLKKKNANLIEERRMEFRIGVNLGEVVEEDGRIYGSGVNLAARLERLTEPGGICISRRAYDHVKTRLDLGYEYLGEHNVKNISEPIRVYRVLMGPETVGKVIGEKRFLGRISRRAAMAIIIVLILAVAGSIAWNIYSRKSGEIETASIEPGQAPVTPVVKEAPKTIAVLPFVNLSPEKDQEYFADGLSEEILHTLTRLPDLTVIGRTSSFSFKGTSRTIQEIASVLGVEHILEGSVRKAGNALRVTAQLVSGVDGSHLWSKSYDRELKDIFAVQEDIATAVADELKVTLGIGESLKQLGGTENIEAYELYLNSKWLRSTNLAITRQALESIDAAIDLDPEFALAWAEKAHNHILLGGFGPYNHHLEEIDAGLKAAQKAIEIEPDLGDGYVHLGYIKGAKREWIEAEHNYRKALELINESLSGDHDFFIVFYMTVGKIKGAQELLKKMRRNDPLNQLIVGWFYSNYGFLGDRQRAEEEYRSRNKLLLRSFSDWHDDDITAVRLGSGDVISRDEIVSSIPINTKLKDYLDSPEEGLMELRRIYSSDDYLNLYDLSMISVWASYFGEPELAMDVIEKHSRMNSLNSYLWFPIFREVRQLPRFKEFVREIGLVDYWKEYGWPDTNICRPVGDDDFECD